MADLSLVSGPLTVTFSGAPWGLVVERDGERLLECLPIGVELATGRRWRAGPVRDLPSPGNETPPDARFARAETVRWQEVDGRYRAELELDGDGRPVHVEVGFVDAWTLSLRATVEGGDVDAIGQWFVAEGGERFLGFGERSDEVSRADGVVECYVGEGPYQPEEYPLLTDTVPPWAMRQRRDAAYYPVPFCCSTRAYGLLVDEDELSYFRLRTEKEWRWSVEVESNRLSWRLFCGRSPLEVLERFTAATGRQPPVERWFFGPWFQTGHDNHVPIEREAELVRLVQAAGPVSAAETHCRYLPVGEDRGHEESERRRVELFHSAGLAALSYLNPLVSADYPEAFAAAPLQRDPSGERYVYQGYAGGREPPHTMEGQYDFTDPTARQAFAAVAARLVAAGYDGWMEDFGEYTPLDAVLADGTTGTGAHNRYPTDYHREVAAATTVFEAATGARLARFARSGWTGSAPHVPIVWGGDPTTSFGFDGLSSAVVEGLSAGASGLAMWGSDIGGFFSIGHELTAELLQRWIAFAAFTPVMRTKSAGIEFPPYRRPQIWDEEIAPVWGRYASLHTRLNDYLMAAHETYRATGRPIMAALELVHPDEPLVAGVADEYLLGPDLLVAPVLEAGATSREVTVPPGRFRSLFGDEVVEGPALVEVAAPVGEIPVFVRAGALLSLLPSEVSSLWRKPPPPHRHLLCCEPAAWSGRLGPGLAGSVEVEGGRVGIVLEAPAGVTFDLEVRTRAALRHATVDGVEVAAAERTGAVEVAVGTGRRVELAFTEP